MGPTNKEHHFHWYQYLYLLVPASRNKACDLPCTAYDCKGLDLILFVPLDLILFCAHLFFIPILIQCNLQNQTQTWPKKLTSCWTNMTEEIDKLLNKHDRINWQVVKQTWPKKLTSSWTNMTEEIDKLLNKQDRRNWQSCWTNRTEESDKLLNKHDRRNWQVVEQTGPKKLTSCWTTWFSEVPEICISIPKPDNMR